MGQYKCSRTEGEEGEAIKTISYQSQYLLIFLGFITKIFGLSEFALIGNWTVLALHGHKVTVNDDVILWILLIYFVFTFSLKKFSIAQNIANTSDFFSRTHKMSQWSLKWKNMVGIYFDTLHTTV